MLLSGWLFADLFLGLMTIFMVSEPPRLIQPPNLKVSPTTLSPFDTQHCQGGLSLPRCTITLFDVHSDGVVDWTASSDMSDTVQFSPATGQITPDHPVTITITNFPCQNGSFTIKGSHNAMPVNVPWKCTLPPPQPDSLETSYRSFTVTLNDVTGLLNNSAQEVNNVKQQVKSQQFLVNRRVGLAIAYGGAPDDGSIPQAQGISRRIYAILGSMRQDTTFPAFQHASYYNPLYNLGDSPNLVTIHVYLFNQ
jgi:hypothetical protein